MAADESANIETTQYSVRLREPMDAGTRGHDPSSRRFNWNYGVVEKPDFELLFEPHVWLSGPAGRASPRGKAASPCSTRFAVRIGESQAHFAFGETASSASTRGSVIEHEITSFGN